MRRLADSAETARGGIQYPRKNVFVPCARRAMRRYCALAHPPSAVDRPQDTVSMINTNDIWASLYLIVEPALAVEEVEKLAVGFTTPKIHIGDLKVAPVCISVSPADRCSTQPRVNLQWQRLYFAPPSSLMKFIMLSSGTRSGCSCMKSISTCQTRRGESELKCRTLDRVP